MTSAAVLPELDVDGPAAPPRRNGELVFEQPWQGRAFGLVMTLADRRVLSWDAFREALITRIATEEATSPSGRSDYYRCWLHALEQVLGESALLTPAELDERASAFAARPPGHDHRHENGHDHGH